MSDLDYANPTLQWTGGIYPEREGIQLHADKTGITLCAWYNGGCGLAIEPHISWEELESMRYNYE